MEKDDLRPLIEANFYQQADAWSRLHDGVNASGLADVLAVKLGKMDGRRIAAADRCCATDEHPRPHGTFLFSGV